MFRTLVSVAAVILAAVWRERVTGNTLFRSALHDYRVVTVVDGLVQPWSIAFLPDGDVLITERPGRLRVMRQGKLLPRGGGGRAEGVPLVAGRTARSHAPSELHLESADLPEFLEAWCDRRSGHDGTRTRPLRGHSVDERRAAFRGHAQGRNHFSGKIAFDRNGYLFLTLGDRQVPPEGNLETHPAQDLSNHHGKIVRLHDDGRVPTDNPFVNRAGARPEIWSYGHRNVQGLAIHPETGDIWTNEHGPQGGDELNRIQPSRNFGWPVIGFGVNYQTGLAIHAGTQREGMEQPAQVWVPSIGISGLMIYTGNRFPEWRGNLFVGGMARHRLARLTLDGQRVINEETLVPQMGRIRDIRQGPDGDIYLVTDNRDGKPTPILRMEPVDRTPIK